MGSAVIDSPETLAPMPRGLVIPDTVEEMFEDEPVIVTIVHKHWLRPKILGAGRGTKKGNVVKAYVPIHKDGIAEYWRIIFPEHLRCEGTFDHGPWPVAPRDRVNLTLRFPKGATSGS